MSLKGLNRRKYVQNFLRFVRDPHYLSCFITTKYGCFMVVSLRAESMVSNRTGCFLSLEKCFSKVIKREDWEEAL